MLTILDRYVLRALLFNYAIALGVMLSLYVVLDMFVNMDEFTEQGHSLVRVIFNIISYYWPNIFLYFSQLAGVIALIACLATLARLRRLNELTAMLASGVSLFRIAGPILVFGLMSTLLLVMNNEFAIPRLAPRLARDRDDIEGSKAYEVLFLRDKEGNLLSAGRFHPATKQLERFLVLARDENGTVKRFIEADQAVWEAPSVPQLPGRWRLSRGRSTQRATFGGSELGPLGETRTEYPSYYESTIGPEEIELRQSEGWIRFVSIAQLHELEKTNPPNRAEIVQTRHARTAAPIMCMVLLLLGVPFFLDRSPASVLNDMGKCLLTCGLCYTINFVAQGVRLGTDSALPAWIPIFIFVPIAIVLIDRIRT